MKKSISQIVVFIGALVALLGTLLDAFIGLPELAAQGAELKSAALFELVLSPVNVITIATVLALCFVFAGKPVLVNVGYALGALAGISGVSVIVLVDFSIAAIGEAIVLVGAVIYLIFVLIKFFGYVKGTTSEPLGKADVAATLNNYKELQTAGIITADEFDSIKHKELATVQIGAVIELKKWKKLLDQKVITEDEFAALKGKLFKN